LVSARRTENSRKRAGAAPAGELPQVRDVRLAGQAAVPGQSEPLGISERRLDEDEGRGVGRGGHRGTSGNSRTRETGPPQAPATNNDRNGRRPPEMNYDMIRS
jgi:hypothetical protein